MQPGNVKTSDNIFLIFFISNHFNVLRKTLGPLCGTTPEADRPGMAMSPGVTDMRADPAGLAVIPRAYARNFCTAKAPMAHESITGVGY